jgi:hypothetical protein
VRSGSRVWWAAKIRQFGLHVRARVSPAERRGIEAWTTPAQRALFDAMHVADRRHGLDVAATLRRDGVADVEVLIAGLLHDAAKGQTGILPRVIYSLGTAYGSWIPRLGAAVPGMRAPLERLRTHAEESARLAEAAGCSNRTVELIRWQDDPRDPVFGEQLRLADEAN